MKKDNLLDSYAVLVYNYQTAIFVRPYIVLDNGTELYGNAASSSVYDIAIEISETMSEDAPYADYINRIIEVCK